MRTTTLQSYIISDVFFLIIGGFIAWLGWHNSDPTNNILENIAIFLIMFIILKSVTHDPIAGFPWHGNPFYMVFIGWLLPLGIISAASHSANYFYYCGLAGYISGIVVGAIRRKK